jgi:hypothetical protein
MIALSRQVTCQKIMAAAREQAWTSPGQVLGLPARLGDEAQYTRHWDLTAIGEVLDQATALKWGPGELTAWDQDGLAHRFAIARPGRTSSDREYQVDQVDQMDLVDPVDLVDQVVDYVVTGPDFDQLLPLAQDGPASAGGRLITGAARRGTSVAWTMTCPAPNPACARPQEANLSRAEAEALASDHDGLHHGGSMTAEVAPTVAVTR